MTTRIAPTINHPRVQYLVIPRNQLDSLMPSPLRSPSGLRSTRRGRFLGDSRGCLPFQSLSNALKNPQNFRKPAVDRSRYVHHNVIARHFLLLLSSVRLASLPPFAWLPPSVPSASVICLPYNRVGNPQAPPGSCQEIRYELIISNGKK